MEPRTTTRAARSLAAAIVLAGAPLGAADLPALDLDRTLALVRPGAGESLWARVPWLTSLEEARRRCAREDRPLFLWRAGGGQALGRA